MAADEIYAELERMVFMVLSIRRSVRPAAEALAWFARAWVTGLLAQIELVTRTSLELAYHTGLAGRRLKLQTAETAYTDTETLFLPSLHCLEAQQSGGAPV